MTTTTEPRTQAGRRLLKGWRMGFNDLDPTSDILAIEAEAAAAPLPLDVDASAKALAFIVVRDREARDQVSRENRWTLPEPLWNSLDENQRSGWRELAATYARLSASTGRPAETER
jgi:hypothetical protein